jgi:hypothetical protein
MERMLWTQDDLRNLIRATYYAGVVSPPAGEELEALWWAEGFRSALTALAIHLGLPPLEADAAGSGRPPAAEPTAIGRKLLNS